MHTNNNFLFFFLVFLYSSLYLLSGVGDSYMSGDEMFFLSDRETEHFKYMLWKTYVGFFKAYDPRVFFIFNNILLLYVLLKLKKVGLVSHKTIVLIFILPSYLYFSNTFLRDFFFFILSFAFIYFVYTNNLIGVVITVLCSLVRPEFTLFYLVSYGIYRYEFKRVTPIIFITIFLFSLAVLKSSSVYESYIQFFVLGHLREKAELGMIGIDIYNLNQFDAALNVLLSPIFFWFIPPSGRGGLFDILLYAETVLIIYLFYNLYKKGNSSLQTLLVSMVSMSFVMAVLTVQHDDNLRFRLMFLPFLFVGIIKK